jgi:pilin isopeptide linkage protein
MSERASAPAEAQIQMTKTIRSNSETIKDGEFTFNMYSNGQLIATAKNDAQGNIIFPPVLINNVGQMDYEVFEVPDYPPKPGWIYDSHQCTAHVSVSEDPVTHELVAQVTYSPAVSPNFVNTYYNPETPVNIADKVIGHGKNISSGEFTFNIVDSNGNVIGQAHNDSEGNIVFPTLNLTGGDYDYKIVPPPDGNGWTFDKPEIPVHVHVADNGDGTAAPVITYPADPDFNATYKASPASTGDLGAPHAAKIVRGGSLSAGQFKFGLYDKDGKLVSESVNNDAGEVFFPSLTFDTTGVNDYTIKEITGDGGGWTADTRSFPYRVTVTDNGMGQLVAADSYPNGTPRFINQYRPAPASTAGSQTPVAVKTVTGIGIENGTFSFGIYDEKGSLVESAANDASGNVAFPPLTFTAPGVYHYTVKESTPDGGGYITDKNSYPLTVTVTDDGNGHLVVNTDPPEPRYSFHNVYSTAGSESILAYKTLKGWQSNQVPPSFNFVLKNDKGEVVKTVQDKDGLIDFGEHIFTEPGDYEYTVTETEPLPAGWTSDKESYRVIVHMEDDGKGNLIASVTYPDSVSAPKFTNTYASRPANAGNVITNNPSGQNPKKTMIGNTKPVVDSYFNFGLYDDEGNLVAIGFSDPDGKIRVPIFMTSKLGTTHYTMKEINVDDRGWTTDRSTFPVDVTVTDNGQGLKLAQVTYPNGTPDFINTYKADDGEADIKAIVIGHGNSIKGGQFEFDVLDKDGNVVGKAVNDADGNIIFPTLTLPDGDYDYTIKAPADGKGWRFDVPSLPVHVHVSDNGDGTSNTVVSYPAGSAFNPVYPPPPVNVGNVISDNPSGENPQKSASGREVKADQFMFGLYDSTGRLVAVGFNTASGGIRFPLFYSNTLGETDYTMKEITVDGNGFYTDKRSYPVKVNITDTGEGALHADVTYPNGTPVFINTPKYPDRISVSFSAFKKVNGAAIAKNGFTFGLYDDSGKLIANASNDENGNITFPAVIYSEAGVYHYTIKETVTAGGGWEVDESVHDITVTVSETPDDKLVASVSYDGGAKLPTFVNTYQSGDKKAAVNLRANKTVCNACLTAKMFTFVLTDSGGNVISTAQNDLYGNVLFDTLQFDTPGVYTYYVKEANTNLPGWVCDCRVITAEITVTENEDGSLETSVKYDGSDEIPMFINRRLC